MEHQETTRRNIRNHKLYRAFYRNNCAYADRNDRIPAIGKEACVCNTYRSVSKISTGANIVSVDIPEGISGDEPRRYANRFI